MVSIVIATYNGANFISNQLSSILIQKCKDIELIIVDDCSQDSTIKIIEQLLTVNNFSNYRMIKNASNCGPTKSFERGVLECRGEYIAICDQDDIWYHEKLTAYLDIAKETMSDIIYSPSLVLKNEKISRSNFPARKTYKTPFGLLLHNGARGATMMVKKDFLAKAVPFYDLYDKWIYLIGCLYGKMTFINKPFQLYRVHDRNYNAGNYRFRSKESLIKKIDSRLEFYQKLLEYVKNDRKLKVRFPFNDVLRALNDIIHFYEEMLYSLNSKESMLCFRKYFENVIKKEHSFSEKLIYLYYFLFKNR